MVKIGAVVATRGPAGLLGNSFLKAIQLAKEDLKNTTEQYDLVIEEIPGPDKAEPAIEKLIKVDKVDALIVGFSMSGDVAKSYATAAKIPLFCICSVGTVGDELYTFTTMPLAEDEAAQWVAEAQRRSIRTIARLTQDYPSIDNHVRALRAEAAKAGIAFVYNDRFEAATTDFTATIAAAKATSPDVYFVEAFNPALDLLGQQLRDAGARDMASIVAFSASQRPELFEGGWYTDSYVSPGFKARLDQRYPASRLATHMMPYAYDSFNMLVQGFESGKEILAYVRGMTEYDGTAGKITKKAGTGNFRSAPAVWVIKNGRPALAGLSGHPMVPDELAIARLALQNRPRAAAGGRRARRCRRRGADRRVRGAAAGSRSGLGRRPPRPDGGGPDPALGLPTQRYTGPGTRQPSAGQTRRKCAWRAPPGHRRRSRPPGDRRPPGRSPATAAALPVLPAVRQPRRARRAHPVHPCRRPPRKAMLTGQPAALHKEVIVRNTILFERHPTCPPPSSRRNHAGTHSRLGPCSKPFKQKSLP